MNQGLVRTLPNGAPAADGSKHGGKTNSASSCSTCSLLFQKVQCHPIPEHSLLPPPSVFLNLQSFHPLVSRSALCKQSSPPLRLPTQQPVINSL